jgi:ParB/RepB/Spo0J family partition protein
MTNELVRRVKLADIRPHPRQTDFFSDLSAADFESLVEDIRRNKLRHPIEILPCGTIVCGHQRVRAAAALGWTEIDAVVLDETDPDEIERRLVEDNLSRRPLGLVGMARIYSALRATARERPSGAMSGDLRDRVAGLMGTRSGRTLDRYVRLLDAPREVQDAVDARIISRATAERVLQLAESDRAELAAQIRAGEDVVTVIARFLRATGESGVVQARKAYRALLLILRRTLPIVKSPHFRKLAGHGLVAEEAIPLLERSAILLRRLAIAERRTLRKSKARFARLAARLRRRR